MSTLKADKTQDTEPPPAGRRARRTAASEARPDDPSGQAPDPEPLPIGRHRLLALWVTSVAAFLTLPAQAAPLKPPPQPWPTPPFSAWVGADTLYVREVPRIPSRLSAVLQMGDTVTVQACHPACDAPRAWAILQPIGAVPLRALRLGPLPAEAHSQSAAATYIYGKVGARVPVYAKADVRSKVIRKEKADFRLAFVPNDGLYAQGWLRRPDGGYMRAKHVKLFTPSTFAGAHEPEAPFAFVRRKVKVKPLKAEPNAEVKVLQRYDRVPVLGLKGGKVLIPGGSVPRNLVRLVTAARRPKEVAAGQRWLHVDTREQVLTAYEGEKLVFATLVSTGKEDRRSTRTPTGKFAVYAKTIHSSMRGKPWDDYYAEEVPWVIHYDGGRALHGAYWHDQFGIQKSHGCINLSPADARWLFEWLPPELPRGWHGVLSLAGGVPVVVEGKERIRPKLKGPDLTQRTPVVHPAGPSTDRAP